MRARVQIPLTPPNNKATQTGGFVIWRKSKSKVGGDCHGLAALAMTVYLGSWAEVAADLRGDYRNLAVREAMKKPTASANSAAGRV